MSAIPMSVSESHAGRTIYDLSTTASDYPPLQGAPLRTIIVCSHMRSGSTLLGEALYFAGGFGCPIEYFHSGFRPTLERNWGVDQGGDYLRELYKRRTDPTGTLGIKLFWVDVVDLCARRFPDQADLLQADLQGDEEAERAVYALVGRVFDELFPNPSFILLSRRDKLRQAVSASISVQTQVWRRIPGIQDNAPVQQPQYDHEQIRGLYASAAYSAARWEGFFQHVGVSPLRVTYEDMIRSYEMTVRTVVTALGGAGEVGVRQPRMKRQASAVSERFMARFLQECQEGSVEGPGGR